MRAMAVGLAVVLGVGGVLGCASERVEVGTGAPGAEPASQTTAEPPRTTPASAPAPRLLTCGGPQFFPSAALDAPSGPFDRSDAAVAAALEHQAEGVTGRVLVRTDDAILVAVDEPETDPTFAPFMAWLATKQDGAWRWQGGGNCRLRAVVDGEGAAAWALDPASPPPGPGSTRIPILVWEQNCNSGEPADGRVQPPVIESRPDAVVVMISVEPRGGVQDCPSNPPTPFVVELDEPLGDRVLLDGGVEPPAPPAGER